jgi:DNA-binding SARP family transcriptional activator
MIQFRALGAVDLRANGQEFRAVLAQPKRIAILTYLALARPRGFHRRDELLAMFWPDAGDERARAALSRAIYFLRRELGEDVIVSRGDEVAVNRDRVWCDATAFEEHCDIGERREALDVYRGDLMPGFFASGGNGFEEWLQGERNRIRELASKTAWDVADDESRSGNHQLSVIWGRRAVELAPFQESGVRRLLLLLESTGDRAGAIFAYEKFAQRLHAELELTPTPETQELIATIRARNHVTNRSTAGVALPTPRSVAIPDLPANALAPRRPRGRRIVMAVGVFLVVIATPALLLARAKRPARSANHVHVANFINRTGDATIDALGRLASKRVIASLTGTGILHVVAAPATPDSGRVDAAEKGRTRLVVPRAGIDRRAGIVVAGEIQRAAGAYHLLASVFDVTASRVVWTIPGVVRDSDSLAAAIDDVSDRITGAVAALASPRFSSWFPTASSPPTFAAFQEFAQGVELQARGAHADALEPLRRAIALDSTFVVAQLQLAVAHANTYDNAADSIAQALLRKRSSLMPLQRHWLDWLLSLGAEDPVAGYRALQAAAELAPRHFLASLAEWAMKLNRPDEARQLLLQLGIDDTQDLGTEYWKLLTRTYHALGDGTSELAAARRARARYPDRMELLELELIALAAQGRVGEVKAVLDTALSFPQAKTGVPSVVIHMPGLGIWPGRLMVATGIELRAHGHEQPAQDMFDRALAWYQTLDPPDENRQTIRREVATALYSARRWAAAESAFRELLESDPSNYAFLGFTGVLAARQGDVQSAERVITLLDAMRPSLPRPHAIAGYWQAKISAVLGDRDRAMRGLTECFGPQGRSGMHTDFDFEGMSSVPAFKAFIRPKG